MSVKMTNLMTYYFRYKVDIHFRYTFVRCFNMCHQAILFTKTTATQNEDALSHYKVRGHIFSGICFCGDYSILITILITMILITF